jgi:hypothetical protein
MRQAPDETDCDFPLSRKSGRCFSCSDAFSMDDVMINEWWIRKNLKENTLDLIELLSQHLPGETEENLLG